MKKIIILLLSILLLFPTVAFADTINVNSSTTESTTEANISMTKASYFKVTIPKSISLDGSSNSTSMDYTVNVEGDLSGHETIFVEPDTSFILTDNAGIKTKEASVIQENDAFTVPTVGTLNKSAKGTISTSGLEAGFYSGSFHFNIHKDTLSDHNWGETFEYEGYLVRKCSICGAIIKDRLVTYTITYNLDGGSATNPISYNVETDSFTLNNPTKTGYTFTGWSGTSLTGSTNTSVTINKGSTGNKEFTAHYSPNTNTKYTVFHKQEGVDGTYTLVDTDNLTGTTGTSVTPATKTYAGFTSPSTQTVTIKPDGSTTVTYNYSRSTFNITYNLNGGSISGQKTTYTIYDETFSLPTPTKTGYTFKGWTGSNGTTAQTSVSITKGSTGDRTYTANWTINTYTITYTLNGGSATNPTSYNVESAAFTLNNPTRAGYVFAGWSGTGISNTSKSVTVAKGSTGNRSYTALWTSASSLSKYDPSDTTVSYTYNSTTGIFTITQKGGSSGWGVGVMCDSTNLQIPWGKEYCYSFMIRVPQTATIRLDHNVKAASGSISGGNDCYTNAYTVTNGTKNGSLTLSANTWYTLEIHFTNGDTSHNPSHVSLLSFSGFGFDLTGKGNFVYEVKDMTSRLVN